MGYVSLAKRNSTQIVVAAREGYFNSQTPPHPTLGESVKPRRASEHLTLPPMFSSASRLQGFKEDEGVRANSGSRSQTDGDGDVENSQTARPVEGVEIEKSNVLMMFVNSLRARIRNDEY